MSFLSKIAHAPRNLIGSVKNKGLNSLSSIGLASGGHGRGRDSPDPPRPWYGPEGPPGGPQSLDPNWSATGPYGLHGEGMMGGMTGPRPAGQQPMAGRMGKTSQRSPAPYDPRMGAVADSQQYGNMNPSRAQAVADARSQQMGQMGQLQMPMQQQTPMQMQTPGLQQSQLNPQLMQQIAGMLGRR